MRLVGLSMLGLAALIGGTMLARAEPPKIEERWALMKANGNASRDMRGLVGSAEGLPRVATLADEIAARLKTAPALFKEGGPGGDALPVAFEKPADFAAAAGKAIDLATALAAAAKSGNLQATQAAYAALGRDGCGGCHQTFRKPQS